MRPHRDHRRRLDHAHSQREGFAPQFSVEISLGIESREQPEDTPLHTEIAVPIVIHIPGALREFTAGRAEVAIAFSRGTVADVLSGLWSLYPGVRDRIVNEQGQVRQHINVFIGNENIRYTGGLASPVADGADVTIVPAVSGG